MGILSGIDTSKPFVSKIKNADPKSPSIIRPGLVYSGHCSSTDCPSYGKYVCCNRGFGTFATEEEVLSGKIVCPTCKNPFSVEYLKFYQSYGYIQEESAPRDARQPFIAAETQLIKFKADGARMSASHGSGGGGFTIVVHANKPMEICVLM